VTQQRPPKNALVLGTTFTGKTHAAATLARYLARPLVVIVHELQDPTYFTGRGSDGRPLVDPDSTEFVGVTRERWQLSPAVLATARANGNRYLYLSVYDLTPEQLQQALASLVASVRAVGDCAVIFDEAHHFASRRNAPPELLAFSRGSRRYGVDLVYVTHRLYDIHVDIRANLTQLILFRTIEQRDLDVLTRQLDLSAAQLAAVRCLLNRRHIVVDRRTGRCSPPQTL